MLTGAFAYVWLYPALQAAVGMFRDWGKVTIPAVTGTSPWLWVAALVASAAVGAYVLEIIRQRWTGVKTGRACMNIPCNVGGEDEAFRLFAGGGLLYIAMCVPVASIWRPVALIGAGGAFTTPITGYCPLNPLMRINKCRVSETTNVEA